MIILRCLGPEEFFLERVVFPFELLSFECPEGSEVEIWTHSLGGPELRETLSTAEMTLEPPELELMNREQKPEQNFQQDFSLAWMEVEVG